MAGAMVLNLAYNLSVEHMTVPWAVLPVALNSVGVSLVFPTISIKMLDRYPLHRALRRRCRRSCGAS
jgi:DHA1 family bicyclomycin/chloramphenicol resistance-like MFS transporter